MRLLITGIHGFVGSNLVASLKTQHILYGLDIVSPAKDGVEKTFSWSDLEKGNIPDVDAVIHLAGKAHDTKNLSEAQVYFDINTGLTQKVYDYFLQSTAQKFIFFSSVKAAADVVLGDVLTEEVVPAPVGPYGESKIKAEEYILENEERRMMNAEEKGKRVFILRPCMIHGPGNKGNLNLLYGVVNKGIPWPLGAFENKRTFTSIDNLCFVVGEMLNRELDGGIYHMADDEALSTNELIEVMCEVMGRKARIWKINRNLMEAVATIGTWLHLPLNRERLGKLTENYVVSNVKIKKALGIERMPVRAKEGLKKTILSFQNQLKS